MLPSARLGLLALLRSIRSIMHVLKSFRLRYVLRSLMYIWSLCFRTSTRDLSKKRASQARPSFPRASGGCEGYSVIHASRDFNRGGEPHLTSGLGDAEVLPLSPVMGEPQSAPRSPASSLASSLPGSLQRSDRQLPEGSTTSIPRSHYADVQPPIRHLNTPVTWTHSRATSGQFTGTPPVRSRSPSLSSRPRPHHLSQSSILESPTASPDHSRPPSPYLFPQPPPLPILESSGGTQLPDVVPNMHDISEGYRQPEIVVFPPSRSQTAELGSQITSNFPQIPTVGEEQSTPGPSYPGGFRLTHGNARHSTGSLRAGSLAPSSNTVRYQLPFPQHFSSQVSVGNIPVSDAPGVWSDGKTRSIGLMHSDQVSRYVNKGDV